MRTLTLQDTLSGRIFSDRFDSIDIAESLGEVKELVKVNLNGCDLGVVKIIHVSTFPYYAINESISQRYLGLSPAYMAAMIKKEWSKKGIEVTRETKIKHFVFEWFSRNKNNFNTTMQNYLNERIEFSQLQNQTV